MKTGLMRDLLTIRAKRRVETTRSWEYQDVEVRNVQAQIEERSGQREAHEGGEFTRVDCVIWVRPLTQKGIELRDRMEVTNRDGRVFDVLSVWPKPRGVPLWWQLKCVERRSANDK